MKVFVRGEREHIKIPSGHSFRVLRWERSVEDVECVVAPGCSVITPGEGAHWHFHVEMELTLFTRGEGTRFVGDHIGPFVAGDMVLLGENLPHYWHARGPSSGVSVQWHFPQSHPFWAFPETLPVGDLFERAKRGLHIGGQTARDVGALLLQIARKQGAEQLATLLHALGRLAGGSDAERQPISSRSFAPAEGPRHQEAITHAVRYVIAHFREETRLEPLLKLTGMSRATFSRQFKIHAGRTFSEFLNRLRLQTACRELEESDRGILEIALASGFTQVSFFNRIFRREHRCSPSEYRARQREKKRGEHETAGPRD
jgi:AraC-like DNA-binding protein